jgi:hypothetical protein
MMRRLVRQRWLLFAAGITLLAVASVTVASLHAHTNGCIFDDGAAYCRMAAGKLATLPFSRRVLVPTVVSWLPGASLVVRFQLVALVCASGTTIATGLLALRLLRNRAATRVAYPAALAAAGFAALSPHLFRLALTEPVLVDQAAIFLGLLWCLLVTSSEGPPRALSPLLALLLVPTREAWLLPLLLATGVMVWMRHRVLAAATLVASLAGAVFTVTRPTWSVGPWSHYSTVVQVLHDGRVVLTHPDHALWAAFFGVGFAAVLALLLLTRWHALRGPLGIVFVVAVGHLLQAPLAGTDVSRYAAAAMPFAVVLAIVATVEVGTSRAFWSLVALTAATMLLWQPFRVAALGVHAYFSMYYPGPASAVIALSGLLLIATALIWVLRSGDALPGSAAGVTP